MNRTNHPPKQIPPLLPTPARWILHHHRRRRIMISPIDPIHTTIALIQFRLSFRISQLMSSTNTEWLTMAAPETRPYTHPFSFRYLLTLAQLLLGGWTSGFGPGRHDPGRGSALLSRCLGVSEINCAVAEVWSRIILQQFNMRSFFPLDSPRAS